MRTVYSLQVRVQPRQIFNRPRHMESITPLNHPDGSQLASAPVLGRSCEFVNDQEDDRVIDFDNLNSLTAAHADVVVPDRHKTQRRRDMC